MARLEVPLAYRRLRTTGDVVVHAELIMAIKTDRGTWELFPFLIVELFSIWGTPMRLRSQRLTSSSGC
jgi:hypothetical protein